MTIRQTLLALCLLGLAACSNYGMGGGNTSSQSGPAGQLSGIALPDGYSVDSSRTLILGEGDRWTGRLAYSINSKAADMFDFYRREMPGMGWSELSVVRAETSVINFSSASTGRVATVQIAPRTLFGSRVDVVIAPQAGGAVAPAAPMAPRSDALPQAPPAAPRSAVRAQPL